MPHNEINYMTAKEMCSQIQTGQLSASQVMQAHLDRIDQLNPRLNAIVSLEPEQALEKAGEADEFQAQGGELGIIHGLPMAHKDLVLTKGMRTTFGSPIYKDFIPDENSLIVERLQNAGCITIGKTNVPEFGAGSQTYNEVFGETLNPYDMSKTCGGSSGGAAVALASGMVPLADGSDLGGSLRNPANFCNIVGFRPSPGRVPSWTPDRPGAAWYPFSVEGPMAKTVEDVALMLTAIAGPDPRCPISIAEPASVFAQDLNRDFKDVQIAYSRDLGGLPVDKRVSEVIEKQLSVFTGIGCSLDEAEPDFSDADEIFKLWRAWRFELAYKNLLENKRDQLKETVIWNIEQAKKISGPELGQAELNRTALYHRMRIFMEKYEFLILPVNQVPPFDVKQRYVTEINGKEMKTYIDWMQSCYFITVTGHPAISVPCGFTPEGLPVGVQIVGRHQADFSVLQLAYAFQQATSFWKTHPEL